MKDKQITQSLPFLIVDDSNIQRQALCKILYALGVSDIAQAENGLEALEFLSRSKYELIISDLHMRGLDGYELLQKVKLSEEFGDTPFIIVSAEDEQDANLQAAMMLASAYIKKPLTPDNIFETINRVIKKRQKEINFDLNILIVDDVNSARKVARRYLTQFGFHNLKEASSAKNAIKEVYKNEINLILTDWNMPELDGIDLIKLLKSSDVTKDIPIIMISSFSEKNKVLEAATAGAVSFISKPYCPQLLFDRIVEASNSTKTKKQQSDTQ